MSNDKMSYIKLDRKIIDWKWFQEANTLKLWLWLLIKANIVSHPFEKETIERGEVATSLDKMSEGTGLSVSQVRTALDHLKSTNEIASRSTRRYQVITILNYDKYQAVSQTKSHAKSQADRSLIASKSQADRRLIAGRSQQLKTVYTGKLEKTEEIVIIPEEKDVIRFFALMDRPEDDARDFYAYNAARGWKIGDAPISDWKPLAQRWQSTRSARPVPDEETDEFGRPVRKWEVMQ